jgi:6,7-dimethyl-8-ribityllumazine synthase
MDLTIGRRLAIGNGVLTTESAEQAWARARLGEGDKGGGAARACLEMIALRRRLTGQGAARGVGFGR